MDQIDRWKSAAKVKKLSRVELPHLPMWNYDACEHHESPDAQCVYRKCGGNLFGYQTVAATYQYMAGKSLNASVPGTGKTAMNLATLCITKHIEKHLRALVIVPTPSLEQWASEAKRWAPGLRSVHIPRGTTKKKRMEYYTQYPLWEVLIVGYHMFPNDAEMIKNIPLNFLVVDDVDPLHNPKNKTHRAIVSVAQECERVIVSNATPTQTHLNNLYGATVAIDAPSVWGRQRAFEARYVKKTPVYIRVRGENNEIENRRTMQVTGYQNMDELARRYAPMHIRYKYSDIAGDVTLPSVLSTDVMLDLTGEQRARYTELQEGLVSVSLDGSTVQQQRISAIAAFTRGSMLIASLTNLDEPDSPEASCKLEWIENNLTSSFEEEKTIIYATHRGTIRTLKERLTKNNIGFATIDGSTKDKKAEQERFWEDENCRVMILSAAGERSLNLQCASVLIMLDSPWNPARVQQIAGRLRRAGSHHSTVHVFKLFAADTQEEKISKVLSARQVVADKVNQETDDSNLFQQLTPQEILELIKP